MEAPFLYSAIFSTYQDMVIAGGAGRNEVRVFDYESGEIVCIINQLGRSVTTIDKAHKS